MGLAEAERAGLLAVLGAFRSPDPRGGPPPPPEPSFAGEFAALEREQVAGPIDAAAVVAALAAEVDHDQAQMFARRLDAVDRALTSEAGASGEGREGRDAALRLLRVGLRVRAAGILAAPGPRVLRLRALADFYYSQYGRVRHRRADPSAPTIAARVAAAAWRAVGPGLDYASLEGMCAEGPVSIHLLRAEPDQIRFEARDCREALAAGRSLVETVAEAGALAAVSGGFFLYSEPDIEAPCRRFDPVGLLLTPGQALRHPPVFRRGSVLVGVDGEVEIDRLGLDGVELELELGEGRGSGRLSLAGAWTRARARVGPDEPSAAIVGDRVVARGEALAVPLNGFVVSLADADAQIVAALEPGAQLRYAPLRSPSGRELASGVAGGPMLVIDGAPVLDLRGEDFWGSAPPVTFSQDETGDQNQLPRLAAGLDGQGRVVLAAVDGRNVERALGMTLAELAALMIELGCVRATNLDGGSSKRMVVEGRSVDLATTEVVVGSERAGASRSRPVHTGLLLFPARREKSPRPRAGANILRTDADFA